MKDYNLLSNSVTLDNCASGNIKTVDIEQNFIELDCVSKKGLVSNLACNTSISFKTIDDKEYKGMVVSYEETGVFAGYLMSSLVLTDVQQCLDFSFVAKFKCWVINLLGIK